MKEEIDFTKVPYQYAMCLNRKCSKANTCLRQLTEQSVPEKIEYWDILSPKHLAALQGDCPYYRSNTKVRYAKRIHQNIRSPAIQTNASCHITSNEFFLAGEPTTGSAKGERLLTPSEQQRILTILKNCGVTHPQDDFDVYVEDYDW